jgi:hypothetical protein
MVPLLIPRSNALDEPAAWSHHLTNFDAASARQAARAVFQTFKPTCRKLAAGHIDSSADSTHKAL